MAINVSFNGATIYKPGAYSQEIIDLGGGFPLSPAGIVLIVGESSQGTPGANEPNLQSVVYTPDQMPAITSKYGSGNIVDACSFLFAPATDGAIPSGAQAVYIYKTNTSTQASLALATGPYGPALASASYGTVQSQAWGTVGNLITYMNVLSPETAPATAGGTIPASNTITTGVNDTIELQLNGATTYTATIAAGTYTSIATLVVAINAALASATPSAVPVTATAGAGSSVVLTMNAAANQYQAGWGRAMEVLAADANTTLGLSVGLNVAAMEPTATITVNNTNNLVSESTTDGGNVVMTIGYGGDSSATAATVSITTNLPSPTPGTVNLVLTITGGSHAGVITLPLAGYTTLNTLAAAISALNTGWAAKVTNSLYGQLPVSSLDAVTAVGALSVANNQPARIKDDAYNVNQFFTMSTSVNMLNQSLVGLPPAAATLLDGGISLAGGTLGGTTDATISNALAAFTGIRVNSVIPLFSRNATADIADGLTDPSSTYMIAAIMQIVKTHLSLTATTKNRSERQGYVSLKDTYENVKMQAGTQADAREQLVFQDVLQVNSLGNIIWFQPWAFACMLAGSRGGAPIGTPLTFKFMNCSGIRATAQPMSTPEVDIVTDFDPNTQYDDAIQSGLTFLEAPQTGGFRIVVDNTTYGADANWVYNRGNVLYAADTVAYNFRNQMEAIYIGVKNTVKASEVSGVAASILSTFLAQGITVSTSDAPNGYKQLQVQIVGNTINIQVTVKLVEGIDFILEQITLQRASSAA